MEKNDTAIFRRLAMPCPMASYPVNVMDGEEIKHPGFTKIENDGTNGKLNFKEGFPGAYSAPKSNEGKYVTRGEMNAIGNLASQNQFYFMAGGINTFDKDFSRAIGGYPEGAVLKYLYNGFLYDVISLHDDNTFDFTINGVDDINWTYLSVPDKTLAERPVFFEGGTGLTTGNALLGVVMARKTGPLLIESSISPTQTQNLISEFRSNNGGQRFTGCGIMIKDVGTDLSNVTDSILAFPDLATIKQYDSNTGLHSFSGWESLTGNWGGFYAGSSAPTGQLTTWILQSQAGSFGFVHEGHYYAIAFLCADGYITTEIYDPDVYTCREFAYSGVQGSLKLTYSI